MTLPSPDAVAKEIFRGLSILGEDAPGADVIRYLTDALTTFAAQQVREAEQAVWGEAARWLEVTSLRDDLAFHAREFRRRSQSV